MFDFLSEIVMMLVIFDTLILYHKADIFFCVSVYV